MSLQTTVKELRDLLHHLTNDLEKAEGGNKAASQRVRTGTVKLEKVAKRYRKESILNERKTKGAKKPDKKAGAKSAKPHAGAKAKSARAGKSTKSIKSAKSAKSAKSVKKTSVKARPLSIRRPTAKLPTRRVNF